MLQDAYERLCQTLGPQHWWPSESALEMMVGAVLTQNTSWRNVELAIQALRDAELLELELLHQVPLAELEELIRPAGYYRLKAKRLKNLLRFIVESYGDIESMMACTMEDLRHGLLTVNGIGPETADSILLYAGNFPTFVIDAYAARIVKRHGWIEPEADYYALKDFFESQLPTDVVLFNEFHALIVAVGKDYCKPRPNCDACPLRDLLPPSGPIDCAPR